MAIQGDMMLVHPWITNGLLGLTGAALVAFSGVLSANPQDGRVTHGAATIRHDTNYTHIQQSSNQAIIEWKKFNIKNNEHTHFQLPSSQSATLNRVSGKHGASNIFGKLSSNGKLFLINPAGVLFGRTAKVDVAGLMATTANIRNSDFMDSRYQFQQSSKYPNASVINYGHIRIKDNGLAALVAPGVENYGVIEAKLGKVALASGNAFTLDLYGDDLIHFTVDGDAEQDTSMTNSVRNSGRIIADGGSVQLTAETASNVVKSVINMDGYIQANTVKQVGGTIFLGSSDGSANVAGILQVLGDDNGEKGGKIKVLADNVTITSKATIDASGHSGGGEVLVGGNYQGQGAEHNANTTSVGPHTLIAANANHQGDGGRVIVWADDTTTFDGTIEAKAGINGGDGGFVETSGKKLLNINGLVDARGNRGKPGTWLLDPTDFTVSDDLAASFNATLDAATSITIKTSETTTDSEEGDINFDNTTTDISWDADADFSAYAHNDIVFSTGATITTSGNGDITLRADSDANDEGTVTFPDTTTTYVSNTNIESVSTGRIELFYNPDSYPTADDYSSNVFADNGAFTAYMLVNSGDDLQAIDASGDYALGIDLDLSSYTGFEPIGKDTSTETITAFTGEFNGDGRTISNLTIDDSSYTSGDNASYIGLFAQTTDATISDLTLSNFDVSGHSSASYYVGILIGDSKNTTTITNVHIIGGTVTGYHYVGAIAGQIDLASTNDEVTINNVSTSASVTGVNEVGSIAGYLTSVQDNSTTTNLTNIINSGDIVGYGSSVGGMLGGTTQDGFLTLDNTINTGSVTGSGRYVGGLLGIVNMNIQDDSTPGLTLTITNSHNTGAINSDYETGYAGGIIGTMEKGNYTTALENVYNTGQVSGGVYYEDGTIAGGIIGRYYLRYNTPTLSMNNVYNTGNIIGNSGGTNGTQMGGIIGQYRVDESLSVPTFSNLYNNGAIDNGADTTNTYAGGIVGYAYDALSFDSTYYYNSETTATVPACGGIDCTGPVSLTSTDLTAEGSYYDGDSEIGFDFTNTWGIIDTVSYPYILATTEVLSGNLTTIVCTDGVCSNTDVTDAVITQQNQAHIIQTDYSTGDAIANTDTTDGNGDYGDILISSTAADMGVPALLDFTDGSTPGNIVYLSSDDTDTDSSVTDNVDGATGTVTLYAAADGTGEFSMAGITTMLDNSDSPTNLMFEIISEYVTDDGYLNYIESNASTYAVTGPAQDMQWVLTNSADTTADNIYDLSSNLWFDNFGTYTSGSGTNYFQYVTQSKETIDINGDSSGDGSGTNTLAGPDITTSWEITESDGGTVTDDTTLEYVLFTEIQNLIGGTEADTFTFSSGASLTNIDGGTGTGSDSLTGADSYTAWTMTTENTGSLSDGSTTISFNNIDDLISGDGNDTFTLAGDFLDSITGSGGANSITRTDESEGSAWVLEVQYAGTMDDMTFSDIQTITAAEDQYNSLTGTDSADTFEITGLNTGSVTDLLDEYTNINKLYGVGGDDQFNIGDSGSLSVSLDGGDGTNSMSAPSDSYAEYPNLNDDTSMGSLYESEDDLLLDYYNIQSFTGISSASFIYTSALTISDALAANFSTTLSSGTSITIKTSDTGSASGDVIFQNTSTAIDWDADADFSVYAYEDIVFLTDTSIATSGDGDITLRADSNVDGSGAVTFQDATATVSSTGSGCIELFYNPIFYPTANDFSNNVSADNGTFKAYMLVNTSDDLQNMTDNMAGTYALGTDLNMSGYMNDQGVGFIPIGTTLTFTVVDDVSYVKSADNIARTHFTGEFNGNNHTISNLQIDFSGDTYTNYDTGGSAYSWVGLFFRLTGAAISDLILDNVEVTGPTETSSYLDVDTGSYDTGSVYGILASDLRGAGTIDNVHIIGGSVSGYKDVGGFVGRLYQETDDAVVDAISNSSNSATITGYNNAIGGIIGYMQGNDALPGFGLTTTLTNVINTGDVTGSYAGGIIGQAQYVGILTLDGVINTGDITSYSGSSGDYFGGFIGSLHETTSNGNSSDISITNSYNIGNISSTSTASGTGGGIIGLFKNDVVNKYTLSLENVYNTGAVEMYSYSSGIIGNYNTSSDINAKLTLENVYNTGSVTGLTNENSSASGGIFGQYYSSNSSNPTFTATDVYSNAYITGSDYLGGIAGYVLTVPLTFDSAYYYDSGSLLAVGGGGGSCEGTCTSISDLTAEASYGDFVFSGATDAIWGIVEDTSYPYILATTEVLSGTMTGSDGIALATGSAITQQNQLHVIQTDLNGDTIATSVLTADISTDESGSDGDYTGILISSTAADMGVPALLDFTDGSTPGNIVYLSSDDTDTDSSVTDNVDGATGTVTLYAAADGTGEFSMAGITTMLDNSDSPTNLMFEIISEYDNTDNDYLNYIQSNDSTYTVIGPAQDMQWVLTNSADTTADNIYDLSSNLWFDNFASYTGGSGTNYFQYVTQSQDTIDIIGDSSGTNTLAGPGETMAWAIPDASTGSATATSTDGTSTNIASFSDIQNLIGSTEADDFTLGGDILDSITGGDGANTITRTDDAGSAWWLTGAYAGTMDDMTFSDIQTITAVDDQSNSLTGTTSDDTFVVSDTPVNSGSVIDSDTGNNLLDGYTNITTLDGASGTNIIIAPNNSSVVTPNLQDGSLYDSDGDHLTDFYNIYLYGSTNITGITYTSANTVSDAMAASFSATLDSGTSVTIKPSNTEAASSDIMFLNTVTAIDWSADADFSVYSYDDISLLKDVSITTSGDGDITLRADSDANGSGTVVFQDQDAETVSITGDGAGRIELFYNPVAFDGYAYPTTYSDNVSTVDDDSFKAYMLVNSGYDLQHITDNLSGAYALGTDLNLEDYNFAIDYNGSSVTDADPYFVPIGKIIPYPWEYDDDGDIEFSITQFTGEINGNGRTISNLLISGERYDGVNGAGVLQGYQGLIWRSCCDVSIYDLNLDSFTVESSGSMSSTLIADMRGGGTIDNVHIIGGTVTGYSNAGGLIGRLYGATDGDTVTISNTSNSATVSATSTNIGGIIGQLVGKDSYTNYGLTTTLSNVINTGSVTSTSQQVGGIIGGASYIGTLDLDGAINTGEITAGGNGYAGGLIGSLGDTSSSDNYSTITIENSYNTGDIVSTAYGAGIVSSFSNTSANDGSVTLTNVYNTGYVTATTYSSGIFGRYKTASETLDPSLTITNTYNTGALIGDSAGNGGGIFGSYEAASEDTANLTDVYSNALITDYNNIGGIAGNVGSTTLTGSLDVGDAAYFYNNGDTNTATCGAGTCTGGTSLELDDLTNLGSYTEFASGTWGIIDGTSYPYILATTEVLEGTLTKASTAIDIQTITQASLAHIIQTDLASTKEVPVYIGASDDDVMMTNETTGTYGNIFISTIAADMGVPALLSFTDNNYGNIVYLSSSDTAEADSVTTGVDGSSSNISLHAKSDGTGVFSMPGFNTMLSSLYDTSNLTFNYLDDTVSYYSPIVSHSQDYTVTGPNQDMQWVLTTSSASTVDNIYDLSSNLWFDSFASYTSGSGTNYFQYDSQHVTPIDIDGDSSGTNTLAGPDIAMSWAITESYGGTVTYDTDSEYVSFTGIQNLIGGTEVDDFTLDSYSLEEQGIDGGTGLGGNTFTGPNAGNSYDIWYVNEKNQGTLYNNFHKRTIADFSNISELGGSIGDDTFSLAGSDLVTSIAGGGGNTNNITRTDSDDSDWVITGEYVGTMDEGTSFSAIEEITGGSGIDTFTVDAGAIMTDIRGSDGDDVFTIAGTVTNVYGNQDNDTFIINDGGSVDSMVGQPGTDSFTVNYGGAVTTTFNGGDDADDFTIHTGASISAIMDGGSGDDTFSIYADLATTIEGGGGTDTITRPDSVSDWVLTGAYAGTIDETTSFIEIEEIIATTGFNNTLTGTSSADDFVVDADNAGSVTGLMSSFSHIGVLYGAGGDDVFDIEEGSVLTTNGSEVGSVDGNSGSNMLEHPSDYHAISTQGNDGKLYENAFGLILYYYNIQDFLNTTTLYIDDIYIPSLLNGIEQQSKTAGDSLNVNQYNKVLLQCNVTNSCDIETLIILQPGLTANTDREDMHDNSDITIEPETDNSTSVDGTETSEVSSTSHDGFMDASMPASKAQYTTADSGNDFLSLDTSFLDSITSGDGGDDNISRVSQDDHVVSMSLLTDNYTGTMNSVMPPDDSQRIVAVTEEPPTTELFTTENSGNDFLSLDTSFLDSITSRDGGDEYDISRISQTGSPGSMSSLLTDNYTGTLNSVMPPDNNSQSITVVTEPSTTELFTSADSDRATLSLNAM